jgi:hypothetical protein
MKTLAKAGAGSFGLLGSDSKYTPRPPITETRFSRKYVERYALFEVLAAQAAESGIDIDVEAEEHDKSFGGNARLRAELAARLKPTTEEE